MFFVQFWKSRFFKFQPEKKKLEKLIDEEQKILQRLELNERVGSKADVERGDFF